SHTLIDRHASSPHGDAFSVSLRTTAATTPIYTLSLRDALPIYQVGPLQKLQELSLQPRRRIPPVEHLGQHDVDGRDSPARLEARSEEHTSELQSRENLVCRLLLEKKKKQKKRESNE